MHEKSFSCKSMFVLQVASSNSLQHLVSVTFDQCHGISASILFSELIDRSAEAWSHLIFCRLSGVRKPTRDAERVVMQVLVYMHQLHIGQAWANKTFTSCQRNCEFGIFSMKTKSKAIDAVNEDLDSLCSSPLFQRSIHLIKSQIECHRENRTPGL